MKLLKRCVFLILTLLIVNSVSGASFLQLNLTRDKVGPEQTFDGYLNFSLSKPVSKYAKFAFHIGSGTQQLSIQEALKGITSLQTIPAEYRKQGSSLGSMSIDFSKADSKTTAGLDLSGRGREPGSIAINSLTLDVTGNNGPKDVAIDIGNDGTYDYRYQSNNFRAYRLGDITYLKDMTIDGSVFIRGTDIFCERATLKPSKKYRVTANVAKLAASDLQLSITNEVQGSKPDCTTEKCCTTTNVQNTQGMTSCEIEKEIPDEGNYSVCVFATAEEAGTNYFKLGTDYDDASIRGYANGGERDEDYFVYAEYGEFDNTLTGTAHATIDSQALNNYISSECGKSCLTIPLTVTTKSAGRVTLSNLALSYEYGGVASELNSFVGISYLSERINYTKPVKLDLVNLQKIIAPKDTGDNEMYAEINTGEETLTSNTVKYKVVQGPKAFIRYGPSIISAGSEVEFDGSGSTKAGNKEIVEYEWDFGDGSKAQGQNVKHSYINTSLYTITLTAIDSDGLVGKDKVVIEVKGGTLSLDSEINNTLNAVRKIKAKIDNGSTQLKDSAQQAGLTSQLNSIEANITFIKNKKESISGNSTASETQKSQITANLATTLSQLKDKIPIDVRVDVTTFNPRILSLNDIPSDLAEDNELKIKILKAQEGLTLNGEARAIKLVYPNNNIEDTIYVKKTISGNGEIYEILPFGSSAREIIMPKDYNYTSPNVIKFESGTSTINYILEGELLFNALSTKTIVIPENLEGIGVKKKKTESVCGDNICDASIEDSNTCPDDCKPKRPIWIFGIVILLIALIAYFGLYFKGGLLKKLLIKKTGRSYFANEKAYLAVKNYVILNKKHGISEEKIKAVLKSKNWKEEQINGVFKDIKEEEKKLKKQQEKFTKKK